jgi:hypothetical protein
MPHSKTKRERRGTATWSTAALFVAGLWCIGLLIGAATLPAYQSTTASVLGASDGSVTSTTRTATLLEVNGPGVLVVVSIPLTAVAVVSVLLLWRRRRRRNGAGPLAWTIVGLLGVLAFLGMLSIGIFILPAAALLALACATAPQSPYRALPPPPLRTAQGRARVRRTF